MIATAKKTANIPESISAEDAFANVLQSLAVWIATTRQEEINRDGFTFHAANPWNLVPDMMRSLSGYLNSKDGHKDMVESLNQESPFGEFMAQFKTVAEMEVEAAVKLIKRG